MILLGCGSLELGSGPCEAALLVLPPDRRVEYGSIGTGVFCGEPAVMELEIEIEYNEGFIKLCKDHWEEFKEALYD